MVLIRSAYLPSPLATSSSPKIRDYLSYNSLFQIFRYLSDQKNLVWKDEITLWMEFKRALSFNPGYACAHLNLGKIDMQEGDSELSYKELKMAMNLALSAGQKELAMSVQQEIDRLSKRSESRLFPLIDEE